MPQISTVERIRLNYSISTIATTVVYTFAIPTFATYFSTLWPHTVYFIIAELLKLVLIQKLYSLDVTYNQDGVRKRRSSKISEGFKFAVLMILVILSFMGIIFVLGGKFLSSFEILYCNHLVSYSFSVRTVRANIHVVNSSRRLDSLPHFNLRGRIWNSIYFVHRVLRTCQPCQPRILKVAQAERFPSHFRSIRGIGCLPLRLGETLADFPNTKHCWSHHSSNDGKLLLLLGVHGQI